MRKTPDKYNEVNAMEYEYPSDNPPITFKIGELSKLYHIGVDSIRYYEKVGILNPIRDEENNYRM